MSSPRQRLSPFWVSLGVVAGLYLLFLVAMLTATASYSSPEDLLKALGKREIQHSIVLSLITCTITALLSLLLAVPVGYLLARARFPGKHWLEAALDIPIVLPPMVMGLCLLILFQTPFGQFVEGFVPFTYTVFGVVLAQFTIGAAFAVRTMRHTFDHLSARPEDVAMTLGCTRAQAVWLVTLPAARRGMFAAASVAWARSLLRPRPPPRLRHYLPPRAAEREALLPPRSSDGTSCSRPPSRGLLDRALPPTSAPALS